MEKKREPAGGRDGEMSAALLSEQSEEEVIEQQWALHPHFPLQFEVSLTSTCARRWQFREQKNVWSDFMCLCKGINSGLNLVLL